MKQRSSPDASEVLERFAANLKSLRERAELTKEALADRAETADSQIVFTEKAASMPRSDTVVKLAGALGVEVAELLRGIDWEPTVGGTAGHFVVSDSDDEPPRP